MHKIVTHESKCAKIWPGRLLKCAKECTKCQVSLQFCGVWFGVEIATLSYEYGGKRCVQLEWGS